jgi:hypothetical protein
MKKILMSEMAETESTLGQDLEDDVSSIQVSPVMSLQRRNSQSLVSRAGIHKCPLVFRVGIHNVL